MRKDPIAKSSELVGAQAHEVVIRDAQSSTQKHDKIIEERPVALVYNGISHAVMMATPVDLEEFAIGFSLTEQIVENFKSIKDLEIIDTDLGIEIQIEITNSAFMNLKQRRRQLTGRTGCGLCGIDSLAAVKPELNTLEYSPLPVFDLVDSAIAKMSGQQYLQHETGASHAAAWVSSKGEVEWIREDVGRHNALDKLLGAVVKNKVNLKNGFVMISSRASFEMVNKAASQGVSTLVAVSAPTSMAIELAQSANMNLLGFVRPGRQVVYSQSQNLIK